MIKLKVVLPTEVKIDEEFEHAVIPGSEGDFGVSEGHTPFITKIRPGVLKTYKTSSNEFTAYAVHDGFVSVEKDLVTIVTETMEDQNSIDTSRAEQAKQRAQERLEKVDSEVDYRRAEFALKRAIARLETIE